MGLHRSATMLYFLKGFLLIYRCACQCILISQHCIYVSSKEICVQNWQRFSWILVLNLCLVKSAFSAFLTLSVHFVYLWLILTRDLGAFWGLNLNCIYLNWTVGIFLKRCLIITCMPYIRRPCPFIWTDTPSSTDQQTWLTQTLPVCKSSLLTAGQWLCLARFLILIVFISYSLYHVQWQWVPIFLF